MIRYSTHLTAIVCCRSQQPRFDPVVNIPASGSSSLTPISKASSGSSAIASAAELHTPVRRIPGPAGKLLQLLSPSPGGAQIVASGNADISSLSNGTVATTKQLARASRSLAFCFDPTHPPWRTMLKFLKLADGSGSNHPYFKSNIAFILREGFLGKVPYLVALVSSFSACDLDAFVTVKDPSGEMPGTIHRKVLDDFAADVNVGAVLVLRNVSIFNASASSHYLNITVDNVVRVFGPDSDPSQLSTEQDSETTVDSMVSVAGLPALLTPPLLSKDPNVTQAGLQQTADMSIAAPGLLTRTPLRFGLFANDSSQSTGSPAALSSTPLSGLDASSSKGYSRSQISAAAADVDLLLCGLDESDLHFVPSFGK